MSADLRAYADERARHYGVPVSLFVKQIQQESGFRPDAFNAASGATGIAQIIPRWHPGVDATDPYASLDYAAKWMADLRRIYGSWAKALAAYNWGPANVAKWDGRRETLPAETRHYLDVILGNGWPEPNNFTNEPESTQNLNTAPRSSFDPTTPDEKQRQDWTCAIRSTMWLLKSIGIDVTPEEAQDAMSPRYVTPELGLLDGSGEGIVEVLRERWGVKAHTLDRPGGPTFDDVLAVAGKQPVAIGGRNWGGQGKGHWSAVRGFDGTRLLLANPASGTVYGDPSLTREQWAWRGPWSAVVVPLAEEPAQPVPDELVALRQQLASLTAQLEDKARRLDTEVSKVGYMTGDLADALQAVVNTLRSLRPPAA